MHLDTGALLDEAAQPTDPARLARTLRTLARVLEIARPVLERAPWPHRWAVSMAVDAVVGAMLAYADRLDPVGVAPDGHGWRTDPAPEGWHLVTTSAGHVVTALRRTGEWLDITGGERDIVAWQPLPPPWRG